MPRRARALSIGLAAAAGQEDVAAARDLAPRLADLLAAPVTSPWRDVRGTWGSAGRAGRSRSVRGHP